MIYRFFLLTIVLLFASAAQATDDDAGLWTSVGLSKPLSDRLTLGTLLQLRFIDEVETLERVLLRPHLAYKLNDRQLLSIGYDAHFIDTPSARVEQRLWQEYQLSRPFSSFTGSLRFRLEQRFIDHIDGVPVRMRVRAAVRKPIPGSVWSFSLANEAFLAINDIDAGQRDGFHENRAFAGFDRRISDDVSFQIGYQNQWIEGGRDRMIHQLIVGFGLSLQ